MPDGVFREYSADYRTDVIDIPLDAGGELEYKLGLNEGDSIVYQWDAVDLKDAEALYAEFHGHTEPVNNVGDLMYYRKATRRQRARHAGRAVHGNSRLVSAQRRRAVDRRAAEGCRVLRAAGAVAS